MYPSDEPLDHFVAHTRELTAYFPYSTRHEEIEATLRAQAIGLLNTKIGDRFLWATKNFDLELLGVAMSRTVPTFL